MADLEHIRDAIQTTLDANAIGLNVYDTVPDLVTLPALLILPVEGEFMVTFARGFDTHNLDLFAMVSRTSPRTGQNSLDAFVTGFGSQSIRRIVFENRTLGLTDGTDARVTGYSRYGGSFPAAGVDHIGAAVRCVVTTPGTA